MPEYNGFPVVYLVWLKPPGESFSTEKAILHSIWFDEDNAYFQERAIQSDPVLWVYEVKVESRMMGDTKDGEPLCEMRPYNDLDTGFVRGYDSEDTSVSPALAGVGDVSEHWDSSDCSCCPDCCCGGE